MAEKPVDDYRAEQRAEWGTYVATEPIDIAGARAFNPGDAVPASHVEGGVVPSWAVAKSTTKAAAAAAASKEG